MGAKKGKTKGKTKGKSKGKTKGKSKGSKNILHSLFIEHAEYLEKALQSMNKAVQYACSHNTEKMKEFIDQTIVFEKKQDRIREKIIENLFGRETMVFSRPDRLLLVNDMNTIVSFAERMARRIELVEIGDYKELLSAITTISDGIGKIGMIACT